jgi:hypothetical protein
MTKEQKVKPALAGMNSPDKVEVHPASSEATVRNLLQHVVKSADAFLKSPKEDALDLDLVRRGCNDVTTHADVLLHAIATLRDTGNPEPFEFALQCLAAVLQGVYLVAGHAGKPESAIQHGIEFGHHLKGADMRNTRAIKLKPHKDIQAEKYKGAKAHIEKRGERATIDRIYDEVSDLRSPNFFAMSKSTIKRLRNKHG